MSDDTEAISNIVKITLPDGRSMSTAAGSPHHLEYLDRTKGTEAAAEPAPVPADVDPAPVVDTEKLVQGKTPASKPASKV